MIDAPRDDLAFKKNLPRKKCGRNLWANENGKLYHDRGLYNIENIDLLCKLIDWFLYDRDLHHERVKKCFPVFCNI